MPQELQPIFADNTQGNSDPVSLEKIRAKAISYAPVLIAFVIAALLCAIAYLKYTIPVYNTSAKLLINEEKGNGMAQGQVFESFGMQTGAATVDNEIEILRSQYLIKQVVKDLHLYIKYYKPGTLRNRELYQTAPFIVIPISGNEYLKNSGSYTLKYTSQSNFTVSANNDTKQYAYGDTVQLNGQKVIIQKNENSVADNDQEYIFSFSPADKISKKILKALDVERSGKQVSILRISIKDIFPTRAQQILAHLIEVYKAAYLQDKHLTSDATISFIDQRLGIVTGDLASIESDIEIFKKQNNFTNLDEQSKILMAGNNDNEKELTQQQIQLNIIESLERFLSANNADIVPSAFFIQDAALATLINSYNELLLQRRRLLLSNVESNPYVKNIDDQILSIRTSMKSNLSSLKSGLTISINEFNRRNNIANATLKTTPTKEREFLEYSRQQNIKQELYLFLLQKREETAINKAATSSNSRVIDPPQTDDKPVSPDKASIILSAIVLGLLIPGTRIVLKEVFNIKITAKEDVEQLTSMPVVAEIDHYNKPNIVAVNKESKTKIAEQFRGLRTNLQFLMSGNNEKVIMLTSSMSGDGKSFIAINLASTLALLGKRVVLMELDLRKPKISENLRLQHPTGFSNYAIGQASINDIITPSGVQDNFFVIPAGTIPPNPAELIVLPAIQQLFANLRSQFDYVIIDTAPIGLVTDAQLLAQHADISLYIVRQNYTFKQQVRNADSLYRAGKLPRMNIVLNDTKTAGSAYGYGSYGNNYFEEEDTNIFTRTLNKLRNK
jgi:capsular exopolysaccharide family